MNWTAVTIPDRRIVEVERALIDVGFIASHGSVRYDSLPIALYHQGVDGQNLVYRFYPTECRNEKWGQVREIVEQYSG